MLMLMFLAETMNNSLNDSELATLRNRFKRDAELLLQSTSVEDDNEKKELKPLPRINRHSVFWMAASVVVTYYLDFFDNILQSEDIKRWWLNVGLLLLSVCISLALYSIVYLEWFRGIQHYDQVYPALPAVTTAAFMAASCSLNLALWPLWSFLTPLILFTQFMGLVMVVSMMG